MNITIQSSSICAGGDHVTVVTDKGTFKLNLSDIITGAPEDFESKERDARAIIKHQFLTRKAAGRTNAQARADLDGFVVRL